MNNLKSFYKYIGYVTVLYVLITAAAFFIKSNFSLIDVVTTGKIFSLFMLLIVNGEIAKDIDKSQKDIRRFNYGILMFVIFVTILTTIKFLGFDIECTSMSDFMKRWFQRGYDAIYWLSGIPLLLYAFLDLYIAYIRKGSENEKNVAKKFVVFVDFVCVFPLLLIYALIMVDSQIITKSSVGIEIFTSGAMAVVLMSSAIAAKAVEEYFGDDND